MRTFSRLAWASSVLIVAGAVGLPGRAVAQAPTVNQNAQGELSENLWSLEVRIDLLRLGSAASAEDLRQREQVIFEIAAVSDPDQRAQLLNRLSMREQAAELEAGTLISPTVREPDEWAEDDEQ